MLSSRRPSRALSHHRRYRPLVEGLEERCLLAAPVVDPIANVTVPAGKTLVVPVTATDTDGNPLTYTATSDNSAVSVEVHAGNPFLKIAVAQQQSDGTLKSLGTMTFELFQDLTPNTVAVITKLVNAGFYDNLIFHRIVPGFVIQGGDPLGTGTGGPGFTFDDEFNPSLIYSGSGQLGMANSGKDSNGSQFFVTVGTNTTTERNIDFNNAIFGQLLRGFDVLNAVNGVATDGSGKPLQDVVITNASIVTDTTDTVLIVKATAGSTAAAHITVTANDGKGGTATQTFTATAAPDTVNDPAILGPVTDQTTAAGQPVTFSLSGTDLENNPLTFEAVLASDSTGNATTSVSGNQVTVTPRAGFVGPIHLKVGVADMGATMRGSTTDPFDTQAITVNVTAATQAATTTMVSPSLTTAVFGQPVTYTATVKPSGTGTGTPTGSVTFKEGNLVLGTSTLNGSGVATLSWTAAPGSSVTVITPGSHTITATYSGDSIFSVSSGTASALTVTPAATTVTVGFSATAPVSGQSLNITAKVTPVAPGAGTPSGMVTFTEGSTTLGTASVNDQGVATFTTSTLAVGSHTITASYAGDPKFTAMTAMGTVAVAKAATTVVVSASPSTSTLGETVTFTAEVAAGAPGGGVPTGTVTFLEGTNTLGTGMLNSQGVATFTTSSLPVGSHTITASFPGDTNFTAMTGTASVTVETATNAWLESVYRVVLGRDVDAVGMSFFGTALDNGTVNRFEVAMTLQFTQEFFLKEIINLYQSLLNRAPDPSGQTAFLRYLSAGHTIEEAKAAMISSDEFSTSRGGGSTSGFLTAIYQDVLGRAVDSTGSTNGTQLLNNGTSRFQFALDVLTSIEGYLKSANKAYERSLNRDGDTAGLLNAIQVMMDGGTDSQILAGVNASDEFFNAV
jgi:cyclophilin family peptidyl-prolyl cis-trans isomerase